MKTRELLTCDTAVLHPKIQGLKPKELRRHIDRIAADLGAPDTDALLARILEAMLALQEPAQIETEEVARNETATIVRALAGHIEVTNENLNSVLRLTLVSANYLRHLMQQRARELRRAGGAGHPHAHHQHGGHPCGDPHCTEHGNERGP
jgi:hypothetical protein